MVWSLFQPNSGALLEGQRVQLREPGFGDYREWVSVRRQSRAFLQPWEPTWSHQEFETAAFRDRIRHYRRERENGTAYTFVIVPKGIGGIAGGITLGKVQHGVCNSGELGYWMGAAYAGKGYMRESLDLVITYAFESLGLQRVEAACIPENARSVRLLEKAGFVREGVMRAYLRINGVRRDHLRFALLKEDRARGNK
jgi:ribosomal-protein-alanine N-acetyltransferase